MTGCARLPLAIIAAGAPLTATWVAAEGPTPAPTRASPAPVFDSSSEVVTVDVVVVDADGRPVPGLQASDFTLTDEDEKQQITAFEAVTLPLAAAADPSPGAAPLPAARTKRVFAVVIDDVHLDAFQAERAKSAVRDLLTSVARDGDVVTLVAPGSGVGKAGVLPLVRGALLERLTVVRGIVIPDRSPHAVSDQEAVAVAAFGDSTVLERIVRRIRTYEPALPEDQIAILASARVREVYARTRASSRTTLEVLDKTLRWLGQGPGRKSLILVSAGLAYDTSLRDLFDAATRASARSNAALYFLDARGLRGLTTSQGIEHGPALDPHDAQAAAFFERFDPYPGADALASDTGGFTIRNTNDLAKGLRRIADESSLYYLLGFTPRHAGKEGRFHKIKVVVSRPGVEVRARKGYFAAGDRHE